MREANETGALVQQLKSNVRPGGSRTKLVAGLILLVLVLIFVFQNLELVSLTFLFWRVNLSEAALITIMLLIGMLTGWALSSALRLRRGHKPYAGTRR